MPDTHSLSLLETVGLQAKTIFTQLEDNFPLVNPTPDTSIEQIMYRAGQRSVVEWIQKQSQE